MKLYYFPGACSQAPHIVAQEAGIPLTLVRLDTKNLRTETGADFRAINPKLFVPVLDLDDGTRLTEAAVILQYLSDLRPQSALLAPFGTRERWTQMEWLNFTATEVHKLFRPLIKDAPEDAKTWNRNLLGPALDVVAAQLGDRDYLLGAFTAVDAYLSVVLGWTRFIKYDTSAWPNINAYLKRVRARDGVRAALRAEGLLKE